MNLETFPRFLEMTGYVTVSGRWLDPRRCPNVGPALLVGGWLVFPRGMARAW